MDAKTKEEKKELKEKLKAERKELRAAKKLERKRALAESIDEDPLKLKDWCSLKGIREEIKKVHWLSKKELAIDSGVVLAFTIVLGLYF